MREGSGRCVRRCRGPWGKHEPRWGSGGPANGVGRVGGGAAAASDKGARHAYCGGGRSWQREREPMAWGSNKPQNQEKQQPEGEVGIREVRRLGEESRASPKVTSF